MAEMGYAQPLRAIGQALERLNMQQFEVETEGENFLVRGSVVIPREKPRQRRRLGRIMELVKQIKNETRLPMADAAPMITELDLRYTRQDIDRLEREAQEKRVDSGGAADAGTLSQLLRTAGAYVNHKGARLIKISRKPAELSITYETAGGQQIVETLAPSELYDFWVRMYLKRAARSSH